MPTEPRPEPATADDLRAVRRWLLVAGVWAVAATAIAVIALIAANRADDDKEQSAQTSSQLAREQSQLSDRLDDLEARLDDLAPAEDVAKLDRRLKQVEQDATKTSDAHRRAERLGRRPGLARRGARAGSASTEEPTDTTTTP